MLGKVIFGSKVVTTTLFVVATSHVIRELYFPLRVYVASETSGAFARCGQVWRVRTLLYGSNLNL